MIQAEWEESLRQMEMILSIVIIPFFGKWWGRKWAYWGESALASRLVRVFATDLAAFDRYSHVGLGKAFFGIR
jgi:hypothetical protein